ncbi:MAG: hypothetical protein H7A53_05785 [Akkermansiaceae bacterium]|nr:hypothetical protein [Akkermansiaceae bacterium]
MQIPRKQDSPAQRDPHEMVRIHPRGKRQLRPVCGLAPLDAFFTALAPAAVAALNGIRFQSECQRLADRSTMMGGILDDHLERLVRLENRMNRYQRGEDRAADPMSWNTDVLLAIEDCARDLARESAEWTVLYAKELPEPG